MAGVNAKALSEGQVSDTQGAILSASGVTYIVPPAAMVFFNTNAAAQTVALYVKRDGTARLIERWVLAQYETAVSAGRYVLEDGDSIEAVTTTASAVNYSVSGGEEV